MSVRVTVADLSAELGGVEILHGVSFEVDRGEFVTLLGPSGSGKTTTLNVIAGFVPQTGGRLALDGHPVEHTPPHSRDIGFVFQNYALFPHMTAGDNVAFPLRTHGIPKSERSQRVSDALRLVGLEGMEKRRTTSLSGGQQQRVALARAIVFEPRLLLLDEPLAALDKGLRETMQVELKRIQQEVGITTIAVTHDQTEALTMSTRVAIMHEGRLEQIDRPEVLYQRPASLFVARFLGEANLLPVDESGNVGGLGMRFPATGGGTAVIRPEDVGIAECGAEGSGRLPARVEQIDFQGVRYRLVARTEADERIIVSLPADRSGEPLEAGAAINVCILRPESVHVIPRQAAAHEEPVAPSASVA